MLKNLVLIVIMPNRDLRQEERISNYILLSLERLVQQQTNVKGQIHSKFAHSFNIKIGDILINVTDNTYSLSCLGVQIKQGNLSQILSSCEVGNIVIYKQHTLYVYTSDAVYPICLNQMSIVDLHIARLSSQVIDKHAYLALLGQIDFPLVTGFDWHDLRLTTYLQVLKNQHYSTNIVTYFVGRGKGLTPSGDDFLLGFLLALKLNNSETTVLQALLQNNITAKTTEISIAYFNAFFAGYLSEQIQQLFIQTNNLQQAIVRVQQYGGTSGNDLLLGIYSGFNSKKMNEKSGK